MQQFEVVLKNYKIRSYRLLAFFLLCLNLVVYVFLLIARVLFYEAAMSSLVIISYSTYCFFRYKKNKENYFITAAAFFVMAGCWLVVSNYIIASCCVLLGILYHFASQKIVFIFNDNVIKKINFPKASYSWKTLGNVILRDDILTLDFNNNNLIQAEIENAQSINEPEFNTFAREQLTSGTF